MNTFSNIFKKSFLEGFAGTEINHRLVIMILATTALLAIYIFLAYRIMTRKTFYSRNFGISLVCVSLITAAIIVTIQSSVVVSLGMVGALSIVRFRTAIKDPMDLAFLFWSISTGIVCGAGLAEYAVILAVFLTVIIAVLNYIPTVRAPMILVINASDLSVEPRLAEIIGKYAKHFNIKSRNMTASSLDLTIELRTDHGAELLQNIMSTEGILGASLLAHDGEATF